MAEEKKEPRWSKGMFTTEDWWAFWLGVLFIIIGLIAAATGVDLMGWVVNFPEWGGKIPISSSIVAAHPDLMPGWASLIITYIIYTTLLCIGTAAMKRNVKEFFIAWNIIFWMSVVITVFGKSAYIQATSLEHEKFGITWSLSLKEFHYVLALFVGLIIGNLAPKNFRDYIKKAARPEWYIKIGIVCLGTVLGVKGIQALGFATDLLTAGAAATIVAYLIFWPLAYIISRKIFKLTKEWAATLGSGISVCGVSASIATGGAIKAKPIVPTMISSIIVIVAMFELLILPPILTYLPFFGINEPIAAGASLGLTVKTDGADAAAGTVLDGLLRARAQEVMGVTWEEGWILSAAVMTKIWIDMFIGIWAFVLATIWVYWIERRPGEKVDKIVIWWRFPKFVIGYFIGMFAIWALGFGGIVPVDNIVYHVFKTVSKPLRGFFFQLTFMSIGLATDFRELRKEGLERVLAAYLFVLFVIIIPIGWFIGWLFHHGMMPPGA